VVKEIHELDRSKLPPIQQLPKTHNMPFRSLGSRFIGRVSDIWHIHDILQNKQTAVIEGVGIIMGTGGLGKTQTAIEYVHRLGYQYPGGIFWIQAEQGRSEMVNDIKQTAHIDLDLLRMALSSDQKSFEPGHPSIAIRQSNLALVLLDLGQLEEARDLLRMALSSDQKSFEPGHPEIAIRQLNLGGVLADLGQTDEAQPLFQASYDASLALLGQDHPLTKSAKSYVDKYC